MKTLSVRRILITALSSLVLLASGTAHAAFRAYLSKSGSDANPCTLQLPCRMLPAALAVVDPWGEVWMLDSANYNGAPVNVNKTVTILAVPGALGSLVASGGDAIIVNTAGVSVTLRNLVITNFNAGGHGINFLQGSRVVVDGCEIYGLPLDGINASAASGSLTVKDSTIRLNGGTGVYLSGTVTGTLSNSKVLYHTNGVQVIDGARGSIDDSLISNTSNMGISVAASGGSASRVVITNSVIKNITNGAIDVLANASSNVSVTLARSTIHFASTGINVQNGAGSAAVILDGNVIVNTALANVNLNSGPGVVYTRNNNTISFTSGSNVLGGALTAMGAL